MQRYGARVAMSGAAIPSPVPSATQTSSGSPLFNLIANSNLMKMVG